MLYFFTFYNNVILFMVFLTDVKSYLKQKKNKFLICVRRSIYSSVKNAKPHLYNITSA